MLKSKIQKLYSKIKRSVLTIHPRTAKLNLGIIILDVILLTHINMHPIYLFMFKFVSAIGRKKFKMPPGKYK